MSEQPTAELIAQLSGSDTEQRRDAAYELVRRGDTSDAVMKAFAVGVQDGDMQVRFQSLLGLSRAGSEAVSALDSLIDCLNHGDSQVRYRAADALGKIGQPAIEPLCAAWQGGRAETKVEVARALAIMGPSVAEPELTDFLLNGLGDDSPDVRRYVADALVVLVPGDLKVLLTLADHPDSQVRKIGIIALAALPSPTQEIHQRLQLAATDDDEKVRETAVIALAKSHLPSADKAVLLEQALLDNAVSVRTAAIACIDRADFDNVSFAQSLARHLLQVDPDIGNTLVKALGELAPASQVALPALLQVSERGSLDNDLMARTIAGFGPSVIGELLSKLEANPNLESVVASSLAIMGEPAVPAMLDGMRSAHEAVRKSSMRALGGVQPAKVEWIKAIEAAYQDDADAVREVAIALLVAAGETAEFTRDTVLAATSDRAASVRAAAFSGLSAFDFSVDERSAAIERGMEDQSVQVRICALQALSEIPRATNQHLDRVARLVSDSNAEVRRAAVAALVHVDRDSEIKKESNDLLSSAVVSALRDTDSEVRVRATTTAEKLSLSTPEVLAALADNLTDDPQLLQATLSALKQFGSKAQSLAHTISQLIDHDVESIRMAAVTTYAAIQTDRQALMRRLTEALQDSQLTVRQAAARSLGELGPDAKAAIPALFQLLASTEDSDFVRGAIRDIDAAPVEALPLLLQGIDSKDHRIVNYAIFLIGKIGPPAAEALPKLEAKLAETEDKADFRRRRLLQAIAAIKDQEPQGDAAADLR